MVRGSTTLRLLGVWGLVRSAQSEHPGRVTLVDVDGEESSWEALGGVLGLEGEPQLVLRRGAALAPRLARVETVATRSDALGERAAFGGDSSVLVTDGTGTLGGLVARHLVAAHGVRCVVLASRHGMGAPGATELRGELEQLGAQVIVAECDVSDRDQVKKLLDRVPAERPLRGVVHVADALAGGVIGSLSPEHIDSVFAPKVDAAWHLHALTRDMDLSAFFFSSATGVLGTPGQGTHAAASALLDALALHRHAQGLVGTSLAWGLWALESRLSKADRARIERSGFPALPSDEGLELLDRACGAQLAQLVPMRMDAAALRSLARVGGLPRVLCGLVRAPARRAGEGGSLARALADVAEKEREGVALKLVRGEVAALLGHASALAVDSGRAFNELGFDSLMAVELRNRLGAITGLRLPATLVFDHPSAAAVARFLLDEVAGAQRRYAAAASSVRAVDEPVAIVGMSCRYPGGVGSPEGLWQLVLAGGDAIGGFPEDRGWNLDALYDPDPDHHGTSYVREGGFVYDAAKFDAGFFGISPREALSMDPQQRLWLEGCWEALEDAGIDPLELRGSQTGVVVGIGASGYGVGLRSGPDERYGVTGASASIVSGRAAYTFGLEGPAVSVDTACSSSLVALHLACGALRAGECSLALAGGVTVLATPVGFVDFSRQRGLSFDGRCKSFADRADGTAWSEGVGVLVLERVSDATRNGHRVLAVVPGSALNQDGASNGLTAPNGPSQQRVIGRALANARLSTRDVDVVEAHGTGTTLGDPIEAQALLATYGQDRPADRPLWLGSVKSNLGHAVAAAGVAGVIKMVKALEHGVLPRTLHVDEPSTHVDWASGSVALLTEEVPWTHHGRPRRAAVSSFGISGTNAHVILEEAPKALDIVPVKSAEIDGGSVGVGHVVPLMLSGKGAAGLRSQAERLQRWMEDSPELDAVDIGFSLSGRPVFDDRAVVLGTGREALLAGLAVLSAGESRAEVIHGATSGERGVAFVFPGQGAQWAGMTVELLDSSPVFAEEMGRCGMALGDLVEWSLEGVLRGREGEPGLDRVDVVQPALWAVMVSLAGLWAACGVRPAAVVGHSQGEIAAACVAGGLSLEDGARVVVARSRALVGLAGRGGMMSVGLGVGEVGNWLEHGNGRVGVAAVNGPSSVVVSGDIEALEELRVELEVGGVRARMIGVDYAAHSAAVEEIREALLEECEGIAPRVGKMPFYWP